MVEEIAVFVDGFRVLIGVGTFQFHTPLTRSNVGLFKWWGRRPLKGQRVSPITRHVGPLAHNAR